MAILPRTKQDIDIMNSPQEPPPGVHIVPFKDYKNGILFETSDRIERDASGKPTTSMPKKRDADRPKTIAKNFVDNEDSTRLQRGFKNGPGKREWHEEFKDLESKRHPGGFNPNTLVTDRVRSAVHEFSKSRPWPNDNNHVSGKSIRNLWEQFELYIGFRMDFPVWTKKKDSAEDDEDEDVDDFSDGEGPSRSSTNVGVQANGRAHTAKKDLKPMLPYSKDPTQVENDEQIQGLIADADALKNDKLYDFCDNPTKAVTIFLSSYIIEQGLVYSDRFLFALPRLVRFFLAYCLNNNVLDSNLLRPALKVVDIAIEELLHTSWIPKKLPDDLNTALLNTFDVRPDVYWPDEADFSTDEPDSKRPRLDTDDQPKTDDQFVKDMEAEGIEVEVLKSEDLPAAQDTNSMDVDDGGWGSSGGWGDNDDDATTPADNPWDAQPSADWAVEQKSLITFLGPTVLPLTHTPGVIEQSTRRIKSVIPPVPTPPKAPVSHHPSPEAVEAEMENRFTRVVLSTWNDPKVNLPVIHRLSKGPTLAAGEELPTSFGGLKPHIPWKDDITIIVENATGELLAKSKGMGLGGTFVQMARQSDFDPTENRTKKKSKRGDERFWYVSGLMQTLPSYHILPDDSPELKPGF